MREPTKEVTINGQKYQIGRMDAMAGSWIAMQIVTKLMPFNLEKMMGLNSETLPGGRSDITEKEFFNIQQHCLRVVGRIESVGNTPTVMPLLMANGQWAIKELQSDVVTVLALTAQALIFNIMPFFEDGALKPLLESFSALSQFSAPTT